MLVNDSDMLAEALANVGRMENVRDLQIINLDGQVRVDSHIEEVGQFRRLGEDGCQECHLFPPESRPRTVKLADGESVLRISTPIKNEPGCDACHLEDGDHLGVLLADVSLHDVEERLFGNLQLELLLSIGATAGAILILYLLFHWLLVRRVEALRQPLTAFAAGNFSSRLPVSNGPTDELGHLAATFNQMADELERHAREQEKRGQMHQQAVNEERERIA